MQAVIADYQAGLQRLNLDISQARAGQTLSLAVLVAALALFLLLLVSAGQRRIPVWTLALPVPAVVVSGRWYSKNKTRCFRAVRLRDFYQRGVDRLEDRWHGTGFSGEEFRQPNHVYDSDLRILGAGSVFELLCTARTGIGRRRLAEYLLEPSDLAESQARQQAVHELKPDAGMRERIALLGKYDFQESTWDRFADWTATPAATAPPSVRTLALASSLFLAGLVLATLTTNLPRQKLLQPVPLLFAIDMAIAWRYRKRTNRLNAVARRVGIEIGVARQGIELISALTVHAPKLQALQQTLRESNAAPFLRQLERLTNALGECDKPYFDLPSQALIVRTQLCFAIEDWKLRHAASVGAWLSAWGEFEALAALSGYAFEHPRDPFPEFREGESNFTATGLGHPLIPASTCVRNDVALHHVNRFYIVSGSNMSGKSTLLRSIGVAAVLAKAGAPVRATSMHLTGLHVFASLSIVDSILEGKSRFFAEVERVRQTLQTARHAPVLFLIDELLSGTNSRDRRIAAECIVRELMANGAIGALSTHDLALTEIASIEGLAGSNVHMGSRPGDDPLDFDYLLKHGITTESNALAIFSLLTNRT
jgi:hypothetical protein